MFLKRYRLLSGLVSASALLTLTSLPASADWSLFRRCKPGLPCPAPAADSQAAPQPKAPAEPKSEPKSEPRLPEPPTPPSDPQPEQVTSAALGSDQISINMFGDAFGKGGKSVVVSFTKYAFTNYYVRDHNSKLQQLQFQPQPFGSPTTFFISTPGQSPDADSVKKGQVFPLASIQPNGPAGSQQIVNGNAVVVQAPGTSFPAIANGSYFVASQIEVDIPNPGSGGVVGRPRLSEDINPLPRDRFIFNYDYFDQTQLTANGQDVNRYTVGFEKTFLDMRTSIEVRVPFASTLASDINIGTQNTRTEFGDVRVLFKALLYSSERFYVASGLGVYLPTAQDTNVSFAGTPLVHVSNRSVVVTPYVGILFLPTDRLFAQIWGAVDVDTNGCPVDVATGPESGLSYAGRIQNQALMQWDFQVGYWLRRPNEGTGPVRGFAPFAELHYGTTVNDADILRTSNGFVIGDLTNRSDELNASAGFATQLANNLLLMVGAAAPMRPTPDRGFDYQIGVRASWFFGPTAAQRRAANFVQSF